MAHQTCTPQEVFGPLEQHLFCGCSVMSFQVSAGWNENESICTVQLVEDTCPSSSNDKIYWNANLVKTTTNAPDPGFTEPEIGSAAYFRVGDFEFCGLIRSWKKVENTQGNTYEVKLEDPRQILEGAHLIINDYAGSLANTFGVYPYNVFNCYGFMEYAGSNWVSCPLGTLNGGVFGAPSSRYAGADNNEAGMPYNYIVTALSILTSCVPRYTDPFSAYGRLLFRSGSSGGYGVLGSDFLGIAGEDLAGYLIDLSELPVAPSYFRLKETSVSILDLISYVCKEAGYDYYIELVPVKYDSDILKIIKVKTVSRLVQPTTLGHIEDYLTTNSNKVLSREVGQELRNEETTSFLIGGNVQSVYQANTNIEAFWGLDGNKNVVVHKVEDDQYIIPFDFTALNSTLYTSLGQNTGEIEENELRAALDSPAAWLTYVVEKPTKFGSILSTSHSLNDGMMEVQMLNDFLNASYDHKTYIPPKYFVKVPDPRSKQDSLTKDIDTMYEYFNNYAREYYGKKWQVHLPYSCWYFNEESQRYFVTDEPSTDGSWSMYWNGTAWVETTSIIGLPHPSAYTDFFSTSELGKTGPILSFPTASNIDLSQHDVNDYGIYNDTLYVKADIDEENVYLDYSNHTSPRVVLTIPDMVYTKLDGDDLTRSAQLIAELLDAAGQSAKYPAVKDIMKNQGSANLLYGMSMTTYVPTQAAVPLRSRINCYGPWCLVGKAGRVKVERNENLVPWEYGSLSAMDTAAQGLVGMGVTHMQVGELGNITVAGYPDRQLGDEIGATSHVVFESRQVSQNSYESFVYYTYDGGGPWQGTYGPNITNVSVNVGPQGMQTTYTMRTFTPQFGRYSKARSERFRQLARQRMIASRNYRINQTTRALIQRALSRKGDKTHRNDMPYQDQHSVVELIVGQQLYAAKSLAAADDDFRHNSIGILPIQEQSQELENWDKKAYMSLDGLVRPVSRAGDGNLPQYVNTAGSQCSKIPHLTEQPLPPIVGYTPAIINQSYLDPLTNPSDTKHGTSVGHDIDILGRNASTPDHSLSIPVEEQLGGDGYANDYRFLALRGPLVIHGWGYDTNGKPIPNESDSDLNAEVGTFEIDDLTDNFMDDWLRKSHCWPVAPVDLRYDRKRGVWSAPPNMRMLIVDTRTGVSPGATVNMDVANYGNHYDDVGDLITNPKIGVNNPFTHYLETGRYIAYFDSADCQYYPISAGATSLTMAEHGCDCSIGGHLQDKKVTYLVVGTGLDLVSSGCNTIAALKDNPDGYTIQSNIKIYQEDVCGKEEIEAKRFGTLRLGTGLSLREDGSNNCDYFIDGGIDITKSSDFGQSNISPSTNKFRISQINVGTGLSAWSGVNCDLTIGLDLRVSDTICGGSIGRFTKQPVHTIVFEEGLFPTLAGGAVHVSGGMQFSTSEVVANDWFDSKNLFEKIEFGKGLQVQELANCTILVSASGSGDLQISNKGCSAPFTEENINGANTRHIVFGSGMRVIDVDDDKYEVHAPISVINEEYPYFTDLDYGEKTSVEHLRFGTGLAVSHNGSPDCIANIDTNMKLHSIDPCDGDTSLSAQRYYGLHFGSGMRVKTATGPGGIIEYEYEISAGGTFVIKDDVEATQTSKDNWGDPYWAQRLIFGTGMAMGWVDRPNTEEGCEAIITPHLLIRNSDCGGGAPDPWHSYKRITAGTGIYISTWNAFEEVRLNAPNWAINDNSYEAQDNLSSSAYQPFEKIKWGKNIRAEQIDACTLGISAEGEGGGSLTASYGGLCNVEDTYSTKPTESTINRIVTHKGIFEGYEAVNSTLHLSAGLTKQTHTECPLPGDCADDYVFSTLKIGKGIKADEGEDCELIIANDLHIEAQYNKGSQATTTKEQIHKITFDNCFYVDSQDDCTANIYLDNSSALGEGFPITEDTIVKVVADVYCQESDGAIVIKYTDLIFNACGLFSKANEDADPPAE